MSYRYFQLIAYRVPTHCGLPAGKPPKLGTEAQTLLNNQLSELEDPSPDLKARLYRMADVVDLAFSSDEIEESADTLKIFVAPEFYFRPEKDEVLAGRSYTEAEKNYLTAALGALRDKRFDNWLFICGTVVWAQDVSALAAAAKVDAKAKWSKYTVWNTALVAVGGSQYRLINKKSYAGADGISNRYWPQLEVKDDAKKTVPTNIGSLTDNADNVRKLKDYLDSELDPARSIFEAAPGLWAGIEICKDHDTFTVNDGLAKLAKTSQGKIDLGFQILTACGMWIEQFRLRIGKGRSIVRADGAPSQPPASEIVRVTSVSSDQKKRTVTESDGADYQSDNTPKKQEALEDDDVVSLKGIDGADAIEKACPQQLVIYKALPLDATANT
jgi:hypothetical protein